MLLFLYLLWVPTFLTSVSRFTNLFRENNLPKSIFKILPVLKTRKYNYKNHWFLKINKNKNNKKHHWQQLIKKIRQPGHKKCVRINQVKIMYKLDIHSYQQPSRTGKIYRYWFKEYIRRLIKTHVAKILARTSQTFQPFFLQLVNRGFPLEGSKLQT